MIVPHRQASWGKSIAGFGMGKSVESSIESLHTEMSGRGGESGKLK